MIAALLVQFVSSVRLETYQRTFSPVACPPGFFVGQTLRCSVRQRQHPLAKCRQSSHRGFAAGINSTLASAEIGA